MKGAGRGDEEKWSERTMKVLSGIQVKMCFKSNYNNKEG